MNPIRKLIALVFILTFTFALPVSTQAIDTVPPIPISDSILRDKEAGITIYGYTIPGLTWDLIAITIAKIALEQILQATTDWINNGFEGNPAYVTDPAQFFTNIADGIAGDFIAGTDLGFLCSPFELKIRIALQKFVTERRQFQCTLTGIVANISDFYKDFSKGGWDGWFSMTQNDTNNPYGSIIQAQIELEERVAAALGIQKEKLTWDSGFLGWSECLEDDPETGECVGRGPTKTPGKVIESQLEDVLGTGVAQLELADEFDELVSALFVQLLKQLVFGAQGLFSGGSIPPPPGEENVYLEVTKYDSGSGTITSSSGEINCGSTCLALYPYGTSVTLTATAAATSIFTGWPGTCEGTGSCTVIMYGDRNAAATFALGKLLTVSKARTGTGTVTSNPAGIDCGSICVKGYEDGVSVTLTASSSAGSVFTGWSGDCSGTGTCSLTMSVNRTVTANYTASPPPSPTGLVQSCVSPGTAAGLAWNPTDGATLYAVRADDTTKNGWNGLCDGSQNPYDQCTNSSTNTYTFPSQPGDNYGWWVHACNSIGCSAPTSGSSFTCVAPISP